MNDRKSKLLSLRIVRRWRRKNLVDLNDHYGYVYAPYMPLICTPDVIPNRQEYLLGYKGSTFFEGPLIIMTP